MHYACRNGSVEILNRLIELGADINAKNDDEMCPVHIACKDGHVDVLNRLIGAGADINIMIEAGVTSIH